MLRSNLAKIVILPNMALPDAIFRLARPSMMFVGELDR
jgi:hypothetical protein